MIDRTIVGFLTFSLKEDVQPAVAVAHSGGSQVSQPDTKRSLIFSLALIIVGRAVFRTRPQARRMPISISLSESR